MPGFDGTGPRSGFNRGRGLNRGLCGRWKSRGLGGDYRCLRNKRFWGRQEQKKKLEAHLEELEEEKMIITQKIRELENN
ncbi:MAG: hypothetical protein ACQEP8_05770 [Chlamydiota bacterium]